MKIEEASRLSVEHLINHGFNDITNERFEIDLLKQFKEEFITELISKVKKGSIYEMEFKPIQYILTPKNRFVFDYRKAAIIGPSCLAKYTCFVFQCAEIIEKHRILTKDQVVFSHRLHISDTNIFDKSVSYSTWKDKTKELILSKKFEYVVECDISSFYDRINIHRLESTLLSIGVDPSIVKNINELLLFWSKKDSYGIPVGNSASRILAEAALIDIDQYLMSEGIIYNRYVDDFRLFAPDLITAQKWMNLLTTRLFRDGLMLNTGKTKLKKIESEKTEIEKEEILSDNEKAEEVLKVVTKLSGGYNRISRKFIMPASEKHKVFSTIDIEKELDVLNKSNIVEFQGIQKITIAILVQAKFIKLADLADICSKYLYGLDYFIDMLLKNKTHIPEQNRNQIADFYEKLVLSKTLYSFEWHSASLAKLLSDQYYFRRNALFFIIKSPGKEVSTYPSLIALEGLFNKITRSEFKTIREWFERCDEWEKRRIIKLSKSLPSDERNAWAKAIKPTISDDILMLEYIRAIIKKQGDEP
ncbi:RNA-directed DNA polymerase [Leptospira sp. 'Mane']|uniref:RNA-directed DNA polymerase n=1 Tax=Leptospira sp. 'Mane' TaxID=3387407 RepID=UPI00398BAD70